jgi:septal ring factor EnvC (AmiA/AmiB activator)
LWPRASLGCETQGQYKPKKKKGKAIQQSQSKINSVLDSLKKKISVIEQAHFETLEVLDINEFGEK